MAGSLTVLCECDETLVDEVGIVGMDVEAEKHESSSAHSTDGVQQVQRLRYQVVRSLTVSLVPEIILELGHTHNQIYIC